MDNKTRRTIAFGLATLTITGILLTVIIYTPAQATPSKTEGVLVNGGRTDWDTIENVLLSILNPKQPQGMQMSKELPPPQQDPCLHCHITGENKGLWTPLFRWTIFGVAGLVFAFGIYRRNL